MKVRIIEKINILNLQYLELEEKILGLNFKKFHAKQIFNWLHKKMETDFENFSNISKEGRVVLKENFFIPELKIVDHQISTKNSTEKFLFELYDKKYIESVLIKHKNHSTLCVSSQIGCTLNCDFCATATMKFERNLDISEILLQFYTIQRILKKNGQKLSNVVFMGMGEPFLNYENVINSIDILNNKDGQEISKRNFTVSTSGLVPYIDKFTELDSQINLAVSLHSANDKIREKLMPVNKKYPLESLRESLIEYQKKTKKRISFEYILIEDLNCSERNASELIDFLKGFSCMVNLIPYNPVNGKVFKTPSRNQQYKFYNKLIKHNINVTLRDTRGQDISAACGQLKAKRELI